MSITKSSSRDNRGFFSPMIGVFFFRFRHFGVVLLNAAHVDDDCVVFFSSCSAVG